MCGPAGKLMPSTAAAASLAADDGYTAVALRRSPPPNTTLNILRAMRSNRWDPDTLAAVHAAVSATKQPAAVRGRTRYHELPDAGHWVHADNPKGLVKLMLPSLAEAASDEGPGGTAAAS